MQHDPKVDRNGEIMFLMIGLFAIPAGIGACLNDAVAGGVCLFACSAIILGLMAWAKIAVRRTCSACGTMSSGKFCRHCGTQLVVDDHHKPQ